MSFFLELNQDLMGIKASDSGCQLLHGWAELCFGRRAEAGSVCCEDVFAELLADNGDDFGMEETPSLCVHRGSLRSAARVKASITQEVWGSDLCFSLVCSRRDTVLVPSPSCARVLSRLLQENWIRTGFCCKLSHYWAAQTLCPPHPFACCHLLCIPRAAGEEGVLPGLLF